MYFYSYLTQAVGRSYDVAVLCVSEEEGVGRHLISRKSFGADDPVMEYVGKQMTNEDALSSQKRQARRGQMISYQVSAAGLYTIDAFETGNLSSFANSSHEHNMSLKPMVVDGVLRMFYVAAKQISPGDELKASYGADYCDNNGIYVECKCDSPKCSGLI